MAQLVESFYHHGVEDLGESLADLIWKGVKYPLYGGNNVIGRKGKNSRIDIKLDHSSVSDIHAEIEQVNDEFYFRDLRSDNGSSVEVIRNNGTKHFVQLARQSIQLTHNCKIRIGSLECSFSYNNEAGRKYSSSSVSSVSNGITANGLAPFSSPNSSDTEATAEVPTQLVDEAQLHNSLIEEHVEIIPQPDPEDTQDNNVISPKKYNKVGGTNIVSSNVVPLRLDSVTSSVCDENTQFIPGGNFNYGDDEDEDVDNDEKEAVRAATLKSDTQYFPTEEVEDDVEYTNVQVDEILNDNESVTDNEVENENCEEVDIDKDDNDSDATDMEDNVITSVPSIRADDVIEDSEPESVTAVVDEAPAAVDEYESDESADLMNVVESQPKRQASIQQKEKEVEEEVSTGEQYVKTESTVTSSASKAPTIAQGSDIPASCEGETFIEVVDVAPVVSEPVNFYNEEATYIVDDNFHPHNVESDTAMESTNNADIGDATHTDMDMEVVNDEVEEEVITAPQSAAEIIKVMDSELTALNEDNDNLSVASTASIGKKKGRAASATRKTSTKSNKAELETIEEVEVKNDDVSVVESTVSVEPVNPKKGKVGRKPSKSIEKASTLPVEEVEVVETPVAAEKSSRAIRRTESEALVVSVVMAAEEPKPSTKRGKSGVASKSNTELNEEPPAATSSKSKKRSAVAAEIEVAEDVRTTPVKKNKTGPSTPTSTPSICRILFTGMDKDKEHLNMAKSLRNAVITEDPTEATHVINGTELKRTAKFMIAINSGVSYVVSLNWLTDSVKSKDKSPIVINSAELQRKYCYQNKEKEKLWNFNLLQTLSLPRGGNNVGVFAGYAYFVWPGVCGNGAPPAEEMKSIVLSGGGMWLESLDIYHNTPERMAAQCCITTSKGKNKVATAPLPGTEVLPLIVVITEAIYKEAQKLVTSAKKAKSSAIPEEYIQILTFLVQRDSEVEVMMYSCEFLFLGCLRQELDFSQNQLDISKVLTVEEVNTGSKSSKRK